MRENKTRKSLLMLASVLVCAAGFNIGAWSAPADDESAEEVNRLFAEYISLRYALEPDNCALAGELRKINRDLSEELERKNRKWNSELTLGVNLARGNSDNSLLNLGFNSTWKSGKSQLNFLLDAGYEEADGEKTAEKGEAEVSYKHELSPRTFAVVLAHVEHDAMADLDYRGYVSPGLGAKFTVLGIGISGSAGPSFVSEKYKNQSASEHLAALFIQEAEWSIDERFKLFQGLRLLAPVDGVEDYILTVSGGAEAELYRRLFLRLTARNAYVNQPAEDKKRNDFSLRSALVWKF